MTIYDGSYVDGADGGVDYDDSGDVGCGSHGRLFCPEAAAPPPLAFEYSTYSSSKIGPEQTSNKQIHGHQQTDRQTTQTDRQAGRQVGRQTGRQTGRQAGRQGGRQAGRQTDRQADRQTDRETCLLYTSPSPRD